MPKKKKAKPSLKDDRKQGQLPIRTNALYVGNSSINVYLTYDQAIQAATSLLKKAELIKGKEEKAVQLWATKGSKTLQFGIIAAVQSGAKEAWE